MPGTSLRDPVGYHGEWATSLKKEQRKHCRLWRRCFGFCIGCQWPWGSDKCHWQLEMHNFCDKWGTEECACMQVRKNYMISNVITVHYKLIVGQGTCGNHKKLDGYTRTLKLGRYRYCTLKWLTALTRVPTSSRSLLRVTLLQSSGSGFKYGSTQTSSHVAFANVKHQLQVQVENLFIDVVYNFGFGEFPRIFKSSVDICT